MRLESSFTLFRYEKRVKWSLLRVLQFWKAIRRCVVDDGECEGCLRNVWMDFCEFGFLLRCGGGKCDEGGYLH